MLKGDALTVEELIDAYTLQEATTDPFRDQVQHDEADTDFQASIQHWNFLPALAILQRTQDLPSARMELALGSIWRRIYLRDTCAYQVRLWHRSLGPQMASHTSIVKLYR
jgi:hypothetical protein